ncbi:two-component response regulator ARR5-like protein [Tanacetum coccineum]
MAKGIASVLAVMTITTDRRFIERLLKGYCFKVSVVDSGTEIPVVIMSSENILTRIDRCLEEGAEDYLLKPVKLADVTRLKDKILKTVNMVSETLLWLHFTISTTSGDGLGGAEMADGGVRGSVMAGSRGDFGKGSII